MKKEMNLLKNASEQNAVSKEFNNLLLFTRNSLFSSSIGNVYGINIIPDVDFSNKESFITNLEDVKLLSKDIHKISSNGNNIILNLNNDIKVELKNNLEDNFRDNQDKHYLVSNYEQIQYSEFKEENCIKIPFINLLNLLEKHSKIISTDDTRTRMNKLKININQDGLHSISTNGFVMVDNYEECNIINVNNVDIYIKYDIANVLYKYLKIIKPQKKDILSKLLNIKIIDNMLYIFSDNILMYISISNNSDFISFDGFEDMDNRYQYEIDTDKVYQFSKYLQDYSTDIDIHIDKNYLKFIVSDECMDISMDIPIIENQTEKGSIEGLSTKMIKTIMSSLIRYSDVFTLSLKEDNCIFYIISKNIKYILISKEPFKKGTDS